MDFYYSDMLDRKSIRDLAEKYGFKNYPHVEKFIMCFEAHHRIAREIDCTVRGGLCMPFHQPGFEVRRMSVDVDIISSRTVEEMRQVMTRIGGRGFKPTELVPTYPYPLDNLVSYNIIYASRFERESHVKVDAFCNANPNITRQSIPSGTRIMDFEIREKMSMLSKGSILADKCTSLAVGTIGLKPDKHVEVVKQIYDIATLLRSSTQNDLATAYESYMLLTEIKVEHFKRTPPYTVPSVTSSIIQTLESRLALDSTITITKDHTSSYKAFSSTYVSKTRQYKKVDHVANVLLVYLFCLSLQRYPADIGPACDQGLLKTSGVCFMHKALEELVLLQNRMPNMSKGERQKTREGYMRDIPHRLIKKRNLKGARLDLVFLMKVVSSASDHCNRSGRV